MTEQRNLSGTVKQMDEWLIFTPGQPRTNEEIISIEQDIEVAIGHSIFPHVVLNIKKWREMPSDVAGMILALGSKIREANGLLRICEATEPVKKILELMGIQSIIPLFETEKEAVSAS